MTSATRLTPVFRPFATHTPITAVETEAAGYAAVSVYYFSSRTISSSGTIEDVTELTNLAGLQRAQIKEMELMKTAKLPREQNPYLLTGRGRKKRWLFLRWTSTGRKVG